MMDHVSVPHPQEELILPWASAMDSAKPYTSSYSTPRLDCTQSGDEVHQLNVDALKGIPVRDILAHVFLFNCRKK